jgi:pSer/pThr/pTyr-binding forkhead associated (FHA) protein
MKARLVGRRRDGTMKSFVLGGQARIGSAPVSEVVVERDRVSPLHALITFEGDAYWVEDKQSQYGTFVNGTRVGKTKLRHFDVLTIAPDVNLVFLTTLPGSARVETNAAPAGIAATIEVPAARAPMAMPQFAATMNEPMPEDVRALMGGALPTGVLDALKEDARSIDATLKPAPAPQARPIDETISIERRPVAEPPISAVRLIGAAGTFTTTLGTCIVGRGSEAAIRINSKEMSRRHAQIVVTPMEVTVEDLQSANGTKVNDNPAAVPTKVGHGDSVAFAGFKFRVEITRLEREG